MGGGFFSDLKEDNERKNAFQFEPQKVCAHTIL
jgi:hypothetical protein